jgi:hypothetical protein
MDECGTMRTDDVGDSPGCLLLSAWINILAAQIFSIVGIDLDVVAVVVVDVVLVTGSLSLELVAVWVVSTNTVGSFCCRCCNNKAWRYFLNTNFCCLRIFDVW